MTKIYINGKFLSQKTTGAQRFSRELIYSLDKLLLNSFDKNEYILMVPGNGLFQDLNLENVVIKRVGILEGHLWEQIELPLHTFGRVLINLSGSAPLLKRRQLITIFDAAIFEKTEAYKKLFITWYRFLYQFQNQFLKTYFITISEYSKTKLMDLLNIPEERICIIPCGAGHMDDISSDISILEKYTICKKQFILAVGSLNPSKNFISLIKAFSKTNNLEGIKLVIVGAENYEVFFDHDLPFDANTIKVGRVSDSELKALYSSARAFIFPSLYEGFGIPPLEAMACDTPSAVSSIQPILEICRDAASFFNPRSLDEIQSTLQEIIDTPNWGSKHIEHFSERLKFFSWDESAKKLHKLILLNFKVA